MSSQVSVARFKFGPWSDDEEEDFWDETAKDAADSRLGILWQLHFNVNYHDGSVAIYFSMSPANYNETLRHTANVTLIFRNSSGDVAYEFSIPTQTYFATDHSNDDWRHWHDNMQENSKNFINWSELKKKDVLVNGVLIIDAVIQFPRKEGHFHVPNSPMVHNISQLLYDEEDKDVFFRTDDEEIFSAHKLILKANAPLLANCCGSDSSPSKPICINGVKPITFRWILLYIYAGKIPSDIPVMDLYAKDLINACDKYDLVGLKHAAESYLVRTCVINIDNVVEWMQFADAKTCPLLKEYAMSYFVARGRDVLKTESYKNLRESPRLMEEIMLATMDVDKGIKAQMGCCPSTNLEQNSVAWEWMWTDQKRYF
ncbi:hypothetical protein ACHAWC_009886 [Mediolabrus comicus]